MPVQDLAVGISGQQEYNRLVLALLPAWRERPRTAETRESAQTPKQTQEPDSTTGAFCSPAVATISARCRTSRWRSSGGRRDPTPRPLLRCALIWERVGNRTGRKGESFHEPQVWYVARR